MTKKEIKAISDLCAGKKLNHIVKSICGEKIGSGLYRDVYVLKQNPKYVVKIERDMSTGVFANATEWRNYIDNLEWNWFSKWLAPCEMITETGQVLIQQRVCFHKERKFYPNHIPALFTDIKVGNFGWIADRFVCCDYSFLLNKVGNKMRTAKWKN